MFALLMIAAAPAPVRVPPPTAPGSTPETMPVPSASPAGPLRLETTVLAETRVAAPDGTTRITLAPPTRVVPGDRMVVRVTYRNVGGQPLAGLVIADPLPRGLAYRAAAATSPEPELSVDGRRYGSLPMLRVALPAGGSRAARADDVAHVRWRLATPLAAGTGGVFAFQAVVK